MIMKSILNRKILMNILVYVMKIKVLFKITIRILYKIMEFMVIKGERM